MDTYKVPRWYHMILNDLAEAVEDSNLMKLDIIYSILDELHKRSAKCYKGIEEGIPSVTAKRELVSMLIHAKQPKSTNKA